MIFGYLLLAIALTISVTAAFYSIAGLTAIFAAAFWPIVIMGSVLELGKIVTTVWLHKYWDRAAIQFKLYLVPAIAILMLITSMGIFGLLSKAHLDQAVPSGDVAAQVQIFDDKIKTEKDNIEAARKALKQMDSQVDERLSRSSDDKGAERAVQIRRSQQKERTNLQNEITTAQKKITALQEQREPIASQARKIEADVGPIRYIAALLYGDNPDAGILEKAVRLVIILIVLVFDPLALVLILAADQTFEWAREDAKKPREKHEGWQQVWQPKTEAWPEWDDEVTEEQIETIKEEANVRDVAMTETLFDTPKDKQPLSISRMFAPASNPDVIVTAPVQQESAEEPAEVKKSRKPRVAAKVKPAEQEKFEDNLEGVSAEDYLDFITENGRTPPNIIEPEPTPDHPHADPEPLIKPNQITIPNFGINEDDTSPVNAGFGTEFPKNPNKGDMFLRVDYLPSRLYKWNEKKWIEVDKTKTDSFAYDTAYIQHLIEKIDSGEYDIDMLSAAEQEQISRYLQNGNTN